MNIEALVNHLANEHGLILVQSEVDEIERKLNEPIEETDPTQPQQNKGL